MADRNPPRPGAWVLLALSQAHHGALTPIQLQKSLFLLGDRRRKEVGRSFYHFRPYDYGPFDVAVYNDADLLVDEGLVAVKGHGGRRLRYYHLTQEGVQEAELLKKEWAPRKALEYLSDVVPWSQSLTFNELVRAVYAEYPEMAVNSVFRDDE